MVMHHLKLLKVFSCSIRSAVLFTAGFLLAYLISKFITHEEAGGDSHQLSLVNKLTFGIFDPSKDQHLHKVLDKVVELSDQRVKNWDDLHEHDHVGENIIAKDLSKKVRVLCWIMTNGRDHKKRAAHVKATWAKRCNNFIFMSDTENRTLHSVDLRIQEGGNILWAKTREAHRYIYRNFINDYDFFFKADDQTFAIIENLRRLLKDVSPSDPVYYGRHFKMPGSKLQKGYITSESGYVLTREALKRLVEKAFKPENPQCLLNFVGPDDVHLAECLTSVGVKIGNSRDALGRERFHPIEPNHLISTTWLPKDHWLWKNSYYPLQLGPNCCSDSTISFHGIGSDHLYELEYYVYHLTPYGIVRDFKHAQRLIKEIGNRDRKEQLQHGGGDGHAMKKQDTTKVLNVHGGHAKA